MNVLQLLELANKVQEEDGHYIRVFKTPGTSLAGLNKTRGRLRKALDDLKAAWLQASPEERAEALTKADRMDYVNGADSAWSRLNDLRHLGQS